MRTIFLVAAVALLALAVLPQPADASTTYVRCGDTWVSPEYYAANAEACTLANVEHPPCDPIDSCL